MIDWPSDGILSPAARENLARFRATGVAKELEADPQSWKFQSWARMPDPPYRMILSNEGSGHLVVVTIEDSGVWNVTRDSLR